MPTTLTAATYTAGVSLTYRPSQTSGHCFYQLSSGDFVAIRNIPDTGETGTVDASRIFHCPGTFSVAATGTDPAVGCTSASGGGGGATAVPVGPFGLLALLAGILGSAFVGLRRKKA